MGRRQLGLSRTAGDALKVLGQQIKTARLQKSWTMDSLAGTAGISRKTLSAIEHGEASVSVGNVFNIASILGVPLFSVEDPHELLVMRRRGEEHLALLPSRVYVEPEDEDGLDF